MAISTPSEVNLINQLTREVQTKIYTNVFFDEFLQSFRKLFAIINFENQNSYAYYQYSDSRYFKFMCTIMSNLRPMQYQAKMILFHELDEANAIHFLEKGKIKFGFEINKKIRFVKQR